MGERGKGPTFGYLGTEDMGGRECEREVRDLFRVGGNVPCLGSAGGSRGREEAVFAAGMHSMHARRVGPAEGAATREVLQAFRR